MLRNSSIYKNYVFPLKPNMLSNLRSEARLRQHSKNQHSIPNNLRPPPGSSAAPSNNNQPSSSSISNHKFSSGGESSVQNETPATQTKSSRIKDQRDAKAKRNEWRITKMVLAIFLSFVLCYLPITIAKIADTGVNYPGLHIFGYIMLYLSSCINPIIYVIMNKQYRQAYKTIILCRTPRLLSFTNAGSSVGGMS